MQLSRGRWTAIGIGILVVATIVHGRLLVMQPDVLTPLHVHAIGLSLAAPGIVLLGALYTGLTVDALLIVVVTVLASTAVVTVLNATGLVGAVGLIALALTAYCVAFAVFTLRNAAYYEQDLPTAG